MAGSDDTGRRRRRFQPFKRLQRLFNRRGKVHITADGVTLDHGDSLEQQSGRVAAGLGASQDSALDAEAEAEADALTAPTDRRLPHHQSATSIPSLPSSSSQLTAELRNVLTKKRSEGADDDSGVPRTPTTSPSAHLQQPPGKVSAGRWGDSDGSLLSVYSSGTATDEEPLTPLSSRSSRLSLTRESHDAEDQQLEVPVPLNHAAAKHRIAVRPRRPRRPRPRTRGTALPATLEETSPEPEPEPTAAQPAALRPESRAEQTEQTDSDAVTRRERSTSPERCRNSLPPYVAAPVEPPPAPAVQRSRSSLADRRLRHLSPMKFFSRAVDPEKKSEGAAGFFSRIFGSRRSGRKAKAGRGAERTTLSSGASASRSTTDLAAQHQRDKSSSEATQKHRADSTAVELPKVGVPPNTRAGESSKSLLSGSPKQLDVLDGAKFKYSEWETYYDSGNDEPSSSHRAKMEPTSRTFEEEKRDTDRTSRSVADSESGSSCCSLCMAESASEPSPAPRRRNSAGSLATDSDADMRGDSESFTMRNKSDIVKLPLESSHQESLSEMSTELSQEGAFNCADCDDSSPVILRRAFPRHSATKESTVTSPRKEEDEPTMREDLECKDLLDSIGSSNRRTYIVAKPQGNAAVNNCNTPESTSKESLNIQETATYRDEESMNPDAEKESESDDIIVDTPSKYADDFLPSGRVPESDVASSHFHNRSSSNNSDILDNTSTSKREEDTDTDGQAIQKCLDGGDLSSRSDSPDISQRRVSGFGVVLRHVSRPEVSIDSGPQSLDSILSHKSGPAEPDVRRRSSNGDVTRELGDKKIDLIGERIEYRDDSKLEKTVKEDREANHAAKNDIKQDVKQQMKNKWSFPVTPQVEKDNEVVSSSRVTRDETKTASSVNVRPSADTDIEARPLGVQVTPQLRPDADNASTPESPSDVSSAQPAAYVPEFMKVHLHKVSSPTAVVTQVVVPKRAAPLLLTTPFVSQKTPELTSMSHKTTDSERISTANVPSSKFAEASVTCVDKAEIEESSEAKVKDRLVTKPAPVLLKDSAVVHGPPLKSPDALSTASSKESPVILRKKPTPVSEESELAKVFKRRSLKLVNNDDAPPKLQTIDSPPILTQPSTEITTTDDTKERQVSAPIPAWRQQKSVVSAPVSAPSADGAPTRPWKPSPTVPVRVRPVVTPEPQSLAPTAEVCLPAAAGTDGATVANTGRDDDSASTANWLKQTVRERREKRELRELKHLRVQPHSKELIIEPETIVPGRSPAARSSRVLAMANTFQKLQPT